MRGGLCLRPSQNELLLYNNGESSGKPPYEDSILIRKERKGTYSISPLYGLGTLWTLRLRGIVIKIIENGTTKIFQSYFLLI